VCTAPHAFVLWQEIQTEESVFATVNICRERQRRCSRPAEAELFSSVPFPSRQASGGPFTSSLGSGPARAERRRRSPTAVPTASSRRESPNRRSAPSSGHVIPSYRRRIIKSCKLEWLGWPFKENPRQLPLGLQLSWHSAIACGSRLLAGHDFLCCLRPFIWRRHLIDEFFNGRRNLSLNHPGNGKFGLQEKFKVFRLADFIKPLRLKKRWKEPKGMKFSYKIWKK